MNWVLVAVICITLYISSSYGATKQNIPPHELDALRDLYYATNGEDWHWKRTGNEWNFTGDPNPCTDQWQGVSCNAVPPTQPRYVVQLSLPKYGLRGQIPDSIGNLTNLNELVLSVNHLSGTIPSIIGNYTILNILSLAFNNLTGTIPLTLDQLSSLTRLELHTNGLNGTLPDAVSRMQNLVSLTLYHNQFSGTIPSSWGNLTHLQDLDLNGNNLVGTLPPSLGDLPQLTNLLTYGNLMTGTIPSSYCNMTLLRQFVIRTNSFTGSIPSCVGAWLNMSFFDVSDNFLTGTLPAGLGNAPHMELLWAHNNSLTGTIPPEWGSLQKLRELYLLDNRLTGTIPPTVGGMERLAYLYLQNNLISGTIPPELSLPSLTLLYMNDNMLSGTIPWQFTSAGTLQEVFLQGNKLRGNLAGLFNRTTHRSLSIVQVSENQLTGELPEEIFSLPRLSTFAASTNCFSGTLTGAFCSSKILATLILDGLRSASACRNPLIPLAHSYTLSGDGHGTIPECLFHMPKLMTLHLSANGLTGTLPVAYPPSHRLIDLALSHNNLQGTIPASFQNRYWSNLDLSFNRFSGSLQAGFQAYPAETTTFNGRNGTSTNTSTGVTYALQNNRLSGSVPQGMVGFENVSMLGSNMFACAFDKSDLPRHDKDYYTYECGSSSFDYPYYVFLGVVLVVVVAQACVLFLPQLTQAPVVATLADCLRNWRLDHATLVTLRHYRYVAAVSDILSRLAVLCTAVIVVILVPWYGAASHLFGTYTHQYAWVISAAFKSGMTPALVELLLYTAFVVLIAVATFYLVVRRDSRLHRNSSKRVMTAAARTSANSTLSAVDPNLASAPRRVAIYMGFCAVNLIAVVGVNVAFVAIALTQSNAVLFLAQILLSMFKLLWNTVCAPNLIRLAGKLISRSYHSAGFVSIQVFVALLNNVAIPCVVVALVSPSCFVNAFSPPPDVHSSFNFYPTIRPGPDLVHVNGYVAVDYISYKPPFSYDYQCSSSFVTYYAPAFVYLAIGAAIVAPTLKALGLLVYAHSAPGSTLHRTATAMLPSILQTPPQDRRSSPGSSMSTASPPTLQEPASSRSPSEVSQPSISRPTSGFLLRHLSTTDRDRTSEDSLTAKPSHRYLFDANIYIITQITYFGILVTFGVVFPPLAVAMCVTMLSVAWQGKLAVGRFLYNARQAQAQHLIDVIEKECKGAVSLLKLRRSLFIVICYACSFYAMFLFDTLGSAQGVMRAFWLLILMPLMPLVLSAFAQARQYREAVSGAERGLGFSLDDASAVELSNRASKKGLHGAAGEVTRNAAALGEEGLNEEDDVEVGGVQATTVNVLAAMARADIHTSN